MQRKEILEQLAAGKLTAEQADERLAAADKPVAGALHCQVAKSGGIRVYGLGRFPVTLYVEQWERMLNFADEIRRFAKEHDAELKKQAK